MDQTKIQYYDLKFEALNARILTMIGRNEEKQRLTRIINRTLQNNALVMGPTGIGKTAFLHGWAKSQQHSPFQIISLEAESFQNANGNPGLVAKFTEGLERIPESAVIIDNFGSLTFNKPQLLAQVTRLLSPLVHSPKQRLIISLTQPEAKWLAEQDPGFHSQFEKITLSTQPTHELIKILERAARLFAQDKIKFESGSLDLIIDLCTKFPNLGQLPLSGITILDEAVALSRSQNRTTVSQKDIYGIIADKTGVPSQQLETSELEQLKQLETKLNDHVIGQSQSLSIIVSTIQRAKLGLKNPNRPLGSFLVLGPSGVGKTETAKLLATHVFGKKEQFVRLDMSEFGQEISVQRLIGAPPGYVGYEAGGGLTEPVQNNPYTLILLDEIEKAHPKIFDVFLQVLDDGRLTSGKSELVDFTQSIIMATSNLGVAEILQGFKNNQDVHGTEFFEQILLPILQKHFRLEFLNRFDAILVFNPLTAQNLLSIARLEIKKVEQRTRKHNITFKLDESILLAQVAKLADPRFGARPIKRFIENTCETLITKTLLQ